MAGCFSNIYIIYVHTTLRNRHFPLLSVDVPLSDRRKIFKKMFDRRVGI